jgi:hypothetical protein
VRSPRPERYDAPLVWLRANKHQLAPLTGTDVKALLAIAYSWKLYSYAGGEEVRAAIGQLLRAMQPKCWRYAKALIPWAMDWGDEFPLWHRLLEDDPELEAIAHRAGVADCFFTDGRRAG